MPHNYKYLSVLTVLFVSVLLISNVASTKVTILGPLTLDGGTYLFPLSYIIGDILTEVYGYSHTRRVIWLGLGMGVLLSCTLLFVDALPTAPDWPHGEAFSKVLGFAPRLVAASLLAYLAGEFINAYILARLKVWMQGRRFWVRAFISTVFGQLADTCIFVGVAFGGILSLEALGVLILSNYVLKVALESLFLPLTNWLIGKLKALEGVDYYDWHTDFRPFGFMRN